MHVWIIAIGLIGVVTGLACAAPCSGLGGTEATPKPDATVRIDFTEPVTAEFLGIGVQWASYPWFEVSPADWEKVTRRVEFLRLPLARVMLDAFWYWRGFDANGQPVFDWDTPYMRKLHQLLDFCERNGTTVMLRRVGPAVRKGRRTSPVRTRAGRRSSANRSCTSCMTASTRASATTT